MTLLQQLSMAATVIKGDKDPLLLVQDWVDKYGSLSWQLAEFPALIAEFKMRSMQQDRERPRVIMVDVVPGLRLANACESTCHAAYSIADVAAYFANKVSKGKLSLKFNIIRKAVRNGTADADLARALSNYQCYEKLHEIRTEWTHYSTVFVTGNQNEEPVFVIKARRRLSDLEHFPTQSIHEVASIISWTRQLLELLDSFAGYLLKTFVLPSFNLDDGFFAWQFDSQGIPLFRDDGTVESGNITIRDYLNGRGVQL